MTKFVSPLKIEMVPGSGLNNWDDKGWYKQKSYLKAINAQLL